MTEPGNENADLRQQLATVIAERDAAEDAHANACKMLAEMHAAAMGEATGPKRGVVEDVADVRAALDAANARVAELEAERAVVLSNHSNPTCLGHRGDAAHDDVWCDPRDKCAVCWMITLTEEKFAANARVAELEDLLGVYKGLHQHCEVEHDCCAETDAVACGKCDNCDRVKNEARVAELEEALSESLGGPFPSDLLLMSVGVGGSDKSLNGVRELCAEWENRRKRHKALLASTEKEKTK